MTLWVCYFTAQTVLIRTRNVKLHMTLGFVGIALAALVVVVGMATAYDAHLVTRNGSARAGSARILSDPYSGYACLRSAFFWRDLFQKTPG